MIPRIAFVAGVLALGAFLLWHPVRSPVVETGAPATSSEPALGDDAGRRAHHHGGRFHANGDDLVVYVAGAVRRPGLYRLRVGDRNARAVALAGGLSAGADAAGVNLAQRAGDGDEIYVPVAGETPRRVSRERHGRRHSIGPPSASVDVNRSDAGTLAAVPGIGRAIAQRIVDLRDREGSFSSLDELLDVAGMTQTRLDRARPYLREP
jgi:competence protein ComEA